MKSFLNAISISQPKLIEKIANEQKMTLLSVQIARTSGFSAPVKSKEPLVFQIGFRRFSACPIFSEHSYQNKFKVCCC